ncbi:MAG: type III-A CRISPR-associated RAMP protein Csm3 [Desulfohalobiaceae bacterium]
MSSSQDYTFQSRIFISGKIETLTGMHVGGNSTEMGIGGADSIVVRDPVTNHPYIPGSSLRGKMRSLLERLRGEMTIKMQNSKDPLTSLSELGQAMSQGQTLDSAGPSTHPEQVASRLFGVSIDKQQEKQPVLQRLVVRDAKLSNPRTLEQARNTDMPLTEVKTEVAIDRITSKANPRQIERVPAGAEFDFQFVLNLFGQDDEQEYLGYVFECMQLLQDDYLGGHGSRGYGRIQFKGIGLARKGLEDYRSNTPGQAIDEVEIPQALQA